MEYGRLGIPKERLAAFCRRWGIAELAVFGSVLREDFGPQSDLDIMITSGPETAWSLLDHLRMKRELTRLVKRRVDLFTRRAVEQSPNWTRRREILDSAEAVYAAE